MRRARRIHGIGGGCPELEGGVSGDGEAFCAGCSKAVTLIRIKSDL